MSSPVAMASSPAGALPPGLAPPPTRRVVSMLGQQSGFEYFDPNEESTTMQSASVEQALRLAEDETGGAALAQYTFASANNAAEQEFDYASAALLLVSTQHGMAVQQQQQTQTAQLQPPPQVISPQQAQALLAAQVLMMQNQSASPPPHPPAHSPPSLGQPGGWLAQPSMQRQASKPTVTDDDDPMAILSMSRGNSNLQAAIDELDSRTGGQASAAYGAAALSPNALTTMAEEPSRSAGSWHDYDGHERDQSGYHSDAYTSATDTEEVDMERESSARAHASSSPRQAYDGSRYPHPHQQQRSPASPPPSTGGGVTHAALQHHNSQYSYGHQSGNAQTAYTLQHAGGGSGHHHSPHYHHLVHHHSATPTVPSVAEQADRENADADADELPELPGGDGATQGSNESDETSGGPTLDASFLHALTSSPPPHNPSYSRSSSATSVSSVPGLGASARSGTSSPQPSQRQILSPTMAQQLAAQHAAAVLSPTPVAGRRSSGHASLGVAHLLHSTSPQPGHASSLVPPPSHRMLGRSNSSDSIPSLHQPTPSASALHRLPSGMSSPTPLTHAHSTRLGPDGRPLLLHPSKDQLSAQQAHAHTPHQSHSPAPHHSVQVKIDQHASGSSTSTLKIEHGILLNQQQAHAAAAHSPMPSMAPHFGRSFSHDGLPSLQSASQQVILMQQQRQAQAQAYKAEQEYYSDGGGDPTYVESATRHIAAFNANYNVPSSAGGSPRGSFSVGPNFHFVGTVRSNASSGTATPLHGPGSLRSSLNGADAHRLLTLHTHGGASHASSLLPTCPTGAASVLSSSSSSVTSASVAGVSTGAHHPHPQLLNAAHASDRIGAYTREERAKRLARYIDKRSRRSFCKRVLYQVRKTFADGRKRVGGRFVSKQNQGCACPDLCVPECPNYVEPSEQSRSPPETASAPPAISKTTSRKKK